MSRGPYTDHLIDRCRAVRAVMERERVSVRKAVEALVAEGRLVPTTRWLLVKRAMRRRRIDTTTPGTEARRC